jgi:hypothetical protein
MRYHVDVACWDDGQWHDAGSVLLPLLPKRYELEHALAVFGVYAPRGWDYVEDNGDDLCIFDAEDAPLARLTRVLAKDAGAVANK